MNLNKMTNNQIKLLTKYLLSLLKSGTICTVLKTDSNGIMPNDSNNSIINFIRDFFFKKRETINRALF